jgi:ectoine hydroxylase-related dioxygenase (phytanoyl-CoA dioxygenase family)
VRRSLSAQELQTFQRDGVVLVREAVTDDWVTRILAAVDRVVAAPPLDGRDGAVRGGGMDRHLFPHDKEFQSFVFETGLAGLVADATGSQQVRIYFDQIFVKEERTDRVFPWHQDHPFWPIRGSQVCSTWLALTHATVESSALEFVKGSHLWGRTYRPHLGPGVTFEDMNNIWPHFGDLASTYVDEIEPFEEHPDRYDVVGFEVHPGDALLFDYRIVHRSRGNSSGNRRVAVSWRWLGDDATWAPVLGADPVIGPEDTFLEAGQRITDDVTFPVAFQATSGSGQRKAARRSLVSVKG